MLPSSDINYLTERGIDQLDHIGSEHDVCGHSEIPTA